MSSHENPATEATPDASLARHTILGPLSEGGGRKWLWRHSSYSQGADQTCVDVAIGPDGVAVRDSKDPAGPFLQFSAREWHVFLLGARDGEFDPPGSSQRLDTGSEQRPGPLR